MILTTLAALIVTGPELTKPVEHPFHQTEQAMIVDAKVNGVDCSFMFDTGYSGVIVMDRSINIGKPTGKMTLRDFVGEFEAETVKLKSLELGPLKIDSKGMEAVSMDQGNMSLSYNAPCDGIMGLEVVSKYVTTINFEKSKFIFHPKSVDISKWVPDNKKTFLLKMLPKGNNSMELKVEHHKGGEFILALDTGNAFYATTHKDVLEREGLWTPGAEPKFTKSSFVASGETKSFNFFMPNTKIFGVPVANSVWDIIDAPSSSADHDGTVGFGFLRNFNITFDIARRRVWLEQFRSPEVEPKADIGIIAFINPGTKRITVYRVMPDSPAVKAGVRPGDEILEIDGKEVVNMNNRQIYSIFEGKLGSTVKFALSRNGSLRRYEIKREHLINNMPKAAETKKAGL